MRTCLTTTDILSRKRWRDTGTVRFGAMSMITTVHTYAQCFLLCKGCILTIPHQYVKVKEQDLDSYEDPPHNTVPQFAIPRRPKPYRERQSPAYDSCGRMKVPKTHRVYMIQPILLLNFSLISNISRARPPVTSQKAFGTPGRHSGRWKLTVNLIRTLEVSMVTSHSLI